MILGHHRQSLVWHQLIARDLVLWGPPVPGAQGLSVLFGWRRFISEHARPGVSLAVGERVGLIPRHVILSERGSGFFKMKTAHPGVSCGKMVLKQR